VNVLEYMGGTGRGAVAMPERPASAAAIRAAAAETLDDAAADERLSARLAVVGATVAIELRGHPDETLVVRMEQGAIAILDGDEPRADIRLSMDATDLHELFAGGLQLPMKIARGQVTYTGQVRRFLRVIAILANMAPVYESHLAEAREREDGP
jgi:alkyl sulfatase BDS1-like metallo-beta-lactamase superfamily hydrolase